MQRFDGIEGLREHIGEHLGYSDWVTVTQEQIDHFADATGDHQWIHTDPVKVAEGPFGATIAHGYLTLSLVPLLISQIYAVDGLSMAMNYGTNRVRFPSIVPVGSRLRAGVELMALEARPPGVQATVRVTIEREGGTKPACIAEVVALLVP